MAKLNEWGRIVKGENTTQDVNIHSISQQAKKFGNIVNDDGYPKYNISDYMEYLKKDLKESWLNEGLDDHKHIIKNDWDYPEELLLWLYSNKFKKIGRGSFSTVFKQDNSNIVVKIIGTGTWNQEDEMFEKWYNFCKQNKSKFLPKFGSIKEFNIDNKKYQIVFTENLQMLPNSKLFSIIAIGNIIKHFYTENNITEEQFNKITKTIDDKEDIPQIKEMIPLLKNIAKNFNKNNLDIQMSNFMMRGNTIVINDIIGQKKKGW